MLSEHLSSHKFLLELLRNRVTTSQKHYAAVSSSFGGFKLWYWNALNDLKVLWNLSKLWKNVSIPFQWKSRRLALVLTALCSSLKKKKRIADTVCRCIVFYLRGEKKKRQVFGACKLIFKGAIAGLHVTFVTAAVLVVKNQNKNTSVLWELNSIFM